MKIGIIGCGYVGQAMAMHWKKKRHCVSVTTRKPEKIPLLKDLADNIFLLGENPLHLFLEKQEALLMSAAPDHGSDYATTYLITAKEIAKHTLKSPNLKSILYTSSTSVYGDHMGAWVDENAKTLPSNENTQILCKTENTLLECQSSKLNICILRLGEIFGPGREIEERLRRMQPRELPGNGQSYTNLIHLNDIVAALDFALEKPLQGIYNLCNDFHIPRKEFYDQICKRENFAPIQWDISRKSTHAGNRRVLSQKIKDSGFVLSHPFYNVIFWPIPPSDC